MVVNPTNCITVNRPQSLHQTIMSESSSAERYKSCRAAPRDRLRVIRERAHSIAGL
jgi:hypothetical protein